MTITFAPNSWIVVGRCLKVADRRSRHYGGRWQVAHSPRPNSRAHVMCQESVIQGVHQGIDRIETLLEDDMVLCREAVCFGE